MGMAVPDCNRLMPEDAQRYVDEIRSPVMRQLTSYGIRVYLFLSDASTFDRNVEGFLNGCTYT